MNSDVNGQMSLLNLLGIKSVEDIENIKVDTDYIINVETRINSLFTNSLGTSGISETNSIFNGMNKKKAELLRNIIDLIKEKLESTNDEKLKEEIIDILES